MDHSLCIVGGEILALLMGNWIITSSVDGIGQEKDEGQGPFYCKLVRPR